MEEINVTELGDRLPDVLRRAHAGERFAVTDHGLAVAEIGPAESSSRTKAREAVRRIREIQTRVKPLGIPIRDAIEEGRM
jgi:antitoxin (DNA-binding transcriptional repressor) of toxin-antitoxin stability system